MNPTTIHPRMLTTGDRTLSPFHGRGVRRHAGARGRARRWASATQAIARFVGAALTGHEVLRLRMVADDGGRRLLRLVLPARLLAHVDAEPVGAEQPGDRGVVLQV